MVPSVTRKSSTGRTRRGTVERQVFDAVERLLAAGEPFTALGVQRIADEAGVARSSFYLHFADKTDLLIRLVESATDELFTVAGRWLAGEGRQTREALTVTTREVIAQRRLHADVLDALAEVSAYDQSAAKFWRDRVEGFIAVLRQRLAEIRDEGRLAAGVDIPTTAHWIAWGLERAVEQPVMGSIADAGTDDALAATLSRGIWLALYGEA